MSGGALGKISFARWGNKSATVSSTNTRNREKKLFGWRDAFGIYIIHAPRKRCLAVFRWVLLLFVNTLTFKSLGTGTRDADNVSSIQSALLCLTNNHLIVFSSKFVVIFYRYLDIQPIIYFDIQLELNLSNAPYLIRGQNSELVRPPIACELTPSSHDSTQLHLFAEGL